MNEQEVTTIVEATIKKFCLKFIESPYLCYTEHGLHALFYAMLHDALPTDRHIAIWKDQKLHIVQKEYPTATPLEKKKRQHWDIAVIRTPPEPLEGRKHPFDCFPLAAVVEFGLNTNREHLQDDIDRLCHPDANVDKRYVVHLYRLGPPGARISGRDLPCTSQLIMERDDMQVMIQNAANNAQIEGYYGMCDSTGKYEQGLWHVDRKCVRPVASNVL